MDHTKAHSTLCARCLRPLPDSVETPPSVWTQLRSGWLPSSHVEVETFRATVSDTRRRILAVDEELAALSVRLARLGDVKAALQRNLDAHQALLAPIRRLPVEIVMEIFRFASQDAKDFMQRWPTILSVSSVTKVWRDIAISMSRIWAALPLNSIQGALRRWSVPRQGSAVSRARIYLSRIGNATLSDSLVFTTRPASALELFKEAMVNSDAIRALHIRECGFFEIFGNRSLPRLVTVFGDVRALSSSGPDEHCVFMRVPRLSRLHLTNVRELPQEHKLQLPWSQIHVLSTKTMTNAYALDAIVAKCPNLRSWRHREYDDDSLDGPSSPTTSHLRLEQLQVLRVDSDDICDWQHKWLFDHLTTPKLGRLFVNWVDWPVNTPKDGVARSPSSCPLAKFLARSNGVRTLLLKNSSKLEQEYVLSREAPSSIVNLSISGAENVPLVPSSVTSLRATEVLPALRRLILKGVKLDKGPRDIIAEMGAERARKNAPLATLDVNGDLDLAER
ncbi:uncharacterized protein SCHCODRAFT_02744006, partial [Schizophyllum commune H4-8]